MGQAAEECHARRIRLNNRRFSPHSICVENTKIKVPFKVVIFLILFVYSPEARSFSHNKYKIKHCKLMP